MIRYGRLARRMRRWRCEIAIAVCIAAAVGILAVSEIQYRALAQGYERVVQAVQLGVRLHELSVRLMAAEAEQRAFVETSGERHLDAYRQSMPGIAEALDRIERAFADAPDAERMFSRLSASVAQSIEAMEVAVQVAAGTVRSERLPSGSSDERAGMTRQARALVDSVAEQEVTLASMAAGEWRWRLDASRLGMGVIMVLNVFLLVALGGAMRRDWRRAHERARLLDRMVRERTRQLDGLASRLQQAAEAEKAAMARELHDEIGAMLTASKLDLSWARSQLPADAVRVSARLAEAIGLLDQGLLAMRRIVEGLRPSTLSHFGLCVAARDHAEQVAVRAGWRLTHAIPASIPGLHPDVEIVLYRVLQESLTNAARHAAAQRVHVELRADGHRCLLEIRDDGIGFSMSDVRPEAQGLFGMRHRVEALTGWFHVDARPGGGTRVSVTVPLQASVAAPRTSREAGRTALHPARA